MLSSRLLSASLVLFSALGAYGSPTQLRSRATTLKAAAGERYFAAALAAAHLSNASDPNFALFAQQQFSGATPENEMKWYVQWASYLIH